MSLRNKIADWLLKGIAPVKQAGVYGGSINVGKGIGGFSLFGTRITVDTFYTLWRSNGDLFACVKQIKDNVCGAGYHWENKDDNNKDADPTQVKLAEQILNYSCSFRNFKNDIIKDHEVTGNGYALILKSVTGMPIGLQKIDPRTLTVVTDQYGNVKKWIQRVQGNTQEFNPKEIAHLKMLQDPDNPVFGLSQVETILWEVKQDIAAMITNYSFFENDATPAAQYILEDGLSDIEADKAIKMLKDQLQGSENKHKSIAIKGIKEIKQISISQRDMEFTGMRKLTTEKICSATGVPKAMLGYTDAVNYANGENQSKSFWENTIAPKEDAFEEWINSILKQCGIDKIKFLANPRDFENKEWNEASSRLDQQQGILTINDLREMRGKEPFDPKVYGEYVDKPIIFNGTATPLEDLGIDLYADPSLMSNEDVKKQVELIEKYSNNYEYGRKKDNKTDKKVDVKAIEEKIKKELEEKHQNDLDSVKKKVTKDFQDKIDKILNE